MATTSPLPPNWTAVLEEIECTLTEATQLAEARELALVHRPAASAAESENVLLKRLQELQRRGEQIQAPLTTLDAVLREEENSVRCHLNAVAALRQRLADWAGLAIG